MNKDIEIKRQKDIARLEKEAAKPLGRGSF